MSILVLGSAMTAETQYPTYMLAKEINIGIIFSRLEFIIASVWITTLFIKITLYFYSGVVGFSQLFGVKNHKRLVIPLGFMVLIISKSAYTNKIYESSWDNLIWMPFITTFSLVLLILLLIVFFIKLQIKNIK
jgi:spore germination protein KB